jgi:hypothetical protein
MNIFFFPFKWSPCFPIVCQPATLKKSKMDMIYPFYKKYIFLIYFRYSWATHARFHRGTNHLSTAVISSVASAIQHTHNRVAYR